MKVGMKVLAFAGMLVGGRYLNSNTEKPNCPASLRFMPLSIISCNAMAVEDIARPIPLALIPLLAGTDSGHVDWMKVGMKVLAFAGMLVGEKPNCPASLRFMPLSIISCNAMAVEDIARPIPPITAVSGYRGHPGAGADSAAGGHR
jgi:hypothetical protein